MDAATITMTVAIAVVGVLATSLFGLVFMMLQNLREDMNAGFASQGERFGRLEAKTDENTAAIKDLEIKMTNKFAEHGERLVRIESRLNSVESRLNSVESKLGIDPPAEAA